MRGHVCFVCVYSLPYACVCWVCICVCVCVCNTHCVLVNSFSAQQLSGNNNTGRLHSDRLLFLFSYTFMCKHVCVPLPFRTPVILQFCICVFHSRVDQHFIIIMLIKNIIVYVCVTLIVCLCACVCVRVVFFALYRLERRSLKESTLKIYPKEGACT